MDESSKTLAALVDKVMGMESRITQHVDTKIDEVKNELRSELKSMVPNGDIPGHRTAHEMLISNAKRWDTFKHDIFKKVAEYGLLAFLGYALVAVVTKFQAGG